MNKALRKTFSLALLVLGSVLVSSCGPQYTDKHYYLDEYSFDDGVNHIEMKELVALRGFECTIEMTINEDQYYFYDIPELARLCNEKQHLEWQCSVTDPDINTYDKYFPKKRNRTLIFRRKQTSFDPNNSWWNFSFRYHTSRYVFHLYPRPREGERI